MVTNARVLSLILPAGLLGLIALSAGCPRAPALPQAAAMRLDFVGNAVCGECHPQEFESHRGSRHDLTLRKADTAGLSELAPRAGRIPGTRYEVRAEQAALLFRRFDRPEKARAMEYAFGSGKTGMTFVAVDDHDTTHEFRMSHFPKTGQWYLTPGQEGIANDDIALPHDPESGRKCFSCHATAQQDDSVRPRDGLFGVGCESCHGPGSLHVQAARQGRMTDLHMEKLGRLGAEALNRLCGRCHRTIEDIELTGTKATMTQRFQPYGLMQSPCFKKSGDRLSCLTCHNPHADAETSHKSYEAACLRCHSAAGTPPPARPVIMQSAPCPVNPRTGCIGCHMPPRKVFPYTDLPVHMADHLIWAYGRKSPRK